MRTGVAVLLATAVSSACVAAAAPAQREDAAATLLRHSQIGITAPRPGHVTIKILKLHLRGKTAALAPLHPRIVFTSSRAARKTILLAAVHTSKRKGSTTYTFILASLTPETRTLALAHRVASQTRAAEPPTVLDPKDQPLRFFVFVTTGVDVGDKIDHVHSFIFGVKGKRCLCGEWESAELPNADASAQRPNLADSFSKVFDDPNLGAAWDPIRDPSQLSDPNLDTGWYDDGH